MKKPQNTRLLVSVRSAAEAIDALEGGADLIDVKEPRRGPLGRAEVETVDAVLQAVGGRKPVSAALGELQEDSLSIVRKYTGLGLRFIKFGLSNCRETAWQAGLLAIREELGTQTSLVPMAYADGVSVAAPAIEEVKTFAEHHRFSHFLLDTFQKDGRGLLDSLEAEACLNTVDAFQTATGIEVALAGSLGLSQISLVLRYQSAWIAVRGAACRDGQRDQTICQARVREIARQLQRAGFPVVSER